VPEVAYYGGRPAPPAYINYLVGPSSTVSGNIVQGNDFGAQSAPVLLPASGFIDGGGNRCVSSETSNILTCLAPSAWIIRR
jgi:hypothetical protein